MKEHIMIDIYIETKHNFSELYNRLTSRVE